MRIVHSLLSCGIDQLVKISKENTKQEFFQKVLSFRHDYPTKIIAAIKHKRKLLSWGFEAKDNILILNTKQFLVKNGAFKACPTCKLIPLT